MISKNFYFGTLVAGVLLSACNREPTKIEKQRSSETQDQSSVATNASTTLEIGQPVASKTHDGEIARIPFIAILKKAEPIPEALSSGKLSIKNNCLVVILKSQPDKIYTAVIPVSYNSASNISIDKFIQIGTRKFLLEREESIPGGAIFIDVDDSIQGKIPASCPLILFGIGE